MSSPRYSFGLRQTIGINALHAGPHGAFGALFQVFLLNTAAFPSTTISFLLGVMSQQLQRGKKLSRRYSLLNCR